LLVRDDDAALHVAAANWSTQREPEDAMMVLQAASNAKPEASVAVLSWLQQTGLEDVRTRKYQ